MISKAFESLGQRALGCYCLHIGGQVYGVRSVDATLLACSYDEVTRRLEERGTHILSLGCDELAQEIAQSVHTAIYEDVPDDMNVCGMTCADLRAALASRNILFAPDGDAAFDDGSHVLHFDQGAQVRLIAFKNVDDLIAKVDSVMDITVSADEFYGILASWKHQFDVAWRAALAEQAEPK